MTWTLKPAGAGTELSLSYSMAGYFPGGGGLRSAMTVDEVLGDQFGRLVKLVGGK
jgi:hypothetical protein